MKDFELGSSLVIPEDVLKNIKEVDDKLLDVQQHVKDTASTWEHSFSKMDAAIAPSIQSLDTLIQKLRDVGNSATAMANAVNGTSSLNANINAIASGAESMAGSISKAADSVDKLSKKKSVTFDDAMSSANSATSINERVEAIKKLTQVRGELSTTDAQYEARLKTLNEAITKLTKANSDAVMTEEQKAAATLKAQKAAITAQGVETARMNAATARANAERRAADEEKRAESSRSRNATRAINDETARMNAVTARANAERKAARSSAAGINDKDEALRMANTAKSINERKDAIIALTNVRDNLNSKDAEYARHLETLNAKIKELNKQNKEAIASSKELSGKYNSLGAIAERMGKRLLLYFGVDTIRNIANQIVAVRGNFELQQRSLEAILQNKNDADQIFNKTVQLAVRSPFKIQELVTYTKQLAAYRIESDKLYDTTKRLADVSAGLGVDMQRLILAYGQVKAAAYLRGTEVRQFTEAGVNMYGELQRYFEDVKGQAYTTAQIVDMISKRKVKFEDIENIFQRLTDKGGLFYHMQEIQSETLRGKIANLADSFDVMYNKIGKENEGLLKTGIESIGSMLKHWKTVASLLENVALLFVGFKIKAWFATSALKDFITQFWQMKGLAKITLVFDTLKSAIYGVGAALKSALPILAVTTLLQLGISLYTNIKKYNEEVKKTTDEYYKQVASVNEISRSFDNAVKNYNYSVSEAGHNGWFANMKKSFLELKSMMEKEGLKISIDVDSLNTNNIANEYKKAVADYKQYLDDIKNINIRLAKDKRNNAWYTFSDNITENANDLSETIHTLEKDFDNYSAVIDKLNSNQMLLTSTTKDTLNKIAALNKEYETETKDYTYFEKMSSLLETIYKAESKTGNFVNSSFVYDLRNIGKAMNDASSDAEKFAKQLDNIFSNINKKDKIKLKAEIDKVAVQEEWDSITQKFAYQHFGIEIGLEKDKIKDDMADIKTQIDNYFAGTKINLSINVSGYDFESGFTQYEEGAKTYLEQLKKVTEGIKRYNKVVAQGNTIEGYDPIAEQAKQNDLMAKLIALGYEEEVKQITEGTKKKNTATKKEVDIIKERIGVLEKMQSSYEKLIKTTASKDAASTIMSVYKDAYTGVGLKLEDNFVPSKENVVAKLRELLKSVKDIVKKTDLKEKIASLQISIDEDKMQEALAKAKSEIDRMFDNVDLHTKLVSMGLGEGDIQRMFGALDVKLADVKDKLLEIFEAKLGAKSTWGSEQIKAYDEYIKKIDKKINDDNYRQFDELTKAYKKQLEGQLAIDSWYAKEKTKIQENEQLKANKSLQDSYLLNLENAYKKKTDENSWKNFKESDMYLALFDNIEQQSTRVLNALRKRLENLRTDLKNLDPSELKAITEQINKVENATIKKNPLGSLVKNMKEYIKFLKQRKSIEKGLIESDSQISSSQLLLKQQSDIVTAKEKEYNTAVATYGITSKEAISAGQQLDIARDNINATQKNLAKQKEVSKEYANQLSKGLKLQETVKKGSKEIIEIANTAISAFGELYQKIGNNNNALTQDILKTFEAAGSLAVSISSGDVAGMITGSAALISSLSDLFSGDNSKTERIQEMERKITKLSRAYDRLKESMDNAWDSQKIIEYKNNTIDAINAQIVLYKNMIATEQDKKSSDSNQIAEWENNIEDLEKQIKELGESFTESLGGIGSEANYKSAAQEFADAWVDAFREGEDALDSLNETFDNYFDNIIKKQVLNRASVKFIEPILKKIDAIVAEGSEGGNSGTDVTEKELAELTKLKNENLAAYNEYLQNFMEALGVTSKTENGLSALQQGIQSVTETTAQALESLLNSMRFYVATQTADITELKNHVIAILGTTSGETSIFKELQKQTKLQQKIHDLLDSVVTVGHTKGRSGIKVFSN